MTIKFKGQTGYGMLADVRAALVAARCPQWRIKHLHHNKNEVTVMAVLPPAPGRKSRREPEVAQSRRRLPVYGEQLLPRGCMRTAIPRQFGFSTCFVCGPDNLRGLRLVFEKEGDTVVTTFTPPLEYGGYGTILHGGVTSTLLDEAMAWAVYGLLNRLSLTTELQIRFLGPVRCGDALTVVGSILSTNEREPPRGRRCGIRRAWCAPRAAAPCVSCPSAPRRAWPAAPRRHNDTQNAGNGGMPITDRRSTDGRGALARRKTRNPAETHFPGSGCRAASAIKPGATGSNTPQEHFQDERTRS